MNVLRGIIRVIETSVRVMFHGSSHLEISPGSCGRRGVFNSYPTQGAKP